MLFAPHARDNAIFATAWKAAPTYFFKPKNRPKSDDLLAGISSYAIPRHSTTQPTLDPDNCSTLIRTG